MHASVAYLFSFVYIYICFIGISLNHHIHLLNWYVFQLAVEIQNGISVIYACIGVCDPYDSDACKKANNWEFCEDEEFNCDALKGDGEILFGHLHF